MEFQGRKKKNNEKFQGVAKVLMEFQGKKEKEQWNISGGGENFDGIPGGLQFLKMDILNRGVQNISGKAQ